MKNNILNILKKCFANPAYFLEHILAFSMGTFYILFYRMTKRNVKIGFPFLASAKVTISGPGRVEIGKNCAVFNNVFRGLTIVTFSKNATVNIGNGCALGGITIRCYNRVEIGDRAMTAVSLIQDSFFVEPGRSQINDECRGPEPQAIVLGRNVWLGADSLVLGGSTIGDDCVLSAGSCCSGINIYKDYSLIIGNPASKSLPIEKLVNFMGVK